MLRFNQKWLVLPVLATVLILQAGCPVIGPTSRNYAPLAWEKPLLEQSSKSTLPLDVRRNPSRYEGQLIHWVGIIDTFWLEQVNDGVLISIELDQKYYDYIEDFSIQREKIFLSPMGEGKFIYTKEMPNAVIDSVASDMSILAARENLGFCYGIFRGIENDMPVLAGQRIRFIHEQFYSTKIFSYEVERDSTGAVIITQQGYPSVTNFQVLRVPTAGEND